jgi:GT2 family glycosyltransferase
MPSNSPLRRLSDPPVHKPLGYVVYEQSEAEMGCLPKDVDVNLVLIRIEQNLGFGGGNNVGLRHALARNDFAYAWILNNDTVIEPDALSELVFHMRSLSRAGICGSTLLYYDDPQRIQALGGAIFNRWFASNRYIGENKTKVLLPKLTTAAANIDFVVGSSMLVSSDLMLSVGLISEDYYLYFEEIDWATRCNGQYDLAYAPRSIVYHKVGSTAGTGTSVKERNAFSEYYLRRNRLRYTARYHPYALPTVYLNLIVNLLVRILMRRWDLVRAVCRVLFGRKWE